MSHQSEICKFSTFLIVDELSAYLFGQKTKNCQNKFKLIILFSFRFVTRLVPSLKPVPECTTIPQEICNLKFTNPRKEKKPLKSEWCLDESPTSPDADTYEAAASQQISTTYGAQPIQSSYGAQPIQSSYGAQPISSSYGVSY